MLEARVHCWVLDDRRVLSNRLRRACNGRLAGQAHFVVHGLVQLLVGVGPAFCIRVFVVGGVAAVGAVHAVLAPWRREVGEAVVVDVKVVVRSAVCLQAERGVGGMIRMGLMTRSGRNEMKG